MHFIQFPVSEFGGFVVLIFIFSNFDINSAYIWKPVKNIFKKESKA